MDFARDDFETIHRRKKLAAWLKTLKGPKKPDPAEVLQHAHNAQLNAGMRSVSAFYVVADLT